MFASRNNPRALSLCVATLLAALIPATLPARDTYPRQPGVDVVHYAWTLTLRDDTDDIAGDAAIDVRFVTDGVRTIEFDLTSATNGKGMTVTAVTLDSAALQFVHDKDRIKITLPAPSRAGAHKIFRVRYHGVPANGLRIIPNKFGDRSFFSENWPNRARQWLPTIDHPYDKATSEFIITAPSKYQVVANGLLQEETDLGNGMRRTHWKQSVPIATWLNAIGVSQFAVRHFGFARGVELQSWVFPQDRENGIITFEIPTRQAIEFFSESVGPYSYEKLADVQAAGIRGGTEHASAIFYGEASVGPREATGLVAHEIAHQWFGNAVTERDWDDVWLSEGFATYFTLLFTEHYSGRDAFVTGLLRSRNTVFATQEKLPEQAVIHNNLDDMTKVLNQLIYQKGGWVLHMLRAQIGTDAFWTGIRDYYRRYRDINASTDDFRNVMENTSHQDLAWFFDQWLKRPGYPVVDGSWRYDATAKRIEIDLAQKQGGAPYRLPLEIGIPADSATQPMRIEKVMLDQNAQHFTIAADHAPTRVVLDPNTWVLMKAHFQ